MASLRARGAAIEALSRLSLQQNNTIRAGVQRTQSPITLLQSFEADACRGIGGVQGFVVKRSSLKSTGQQGVIGADTGDVRAYNVGFAASALFRPGVAFADAVGTGSDSSQGEADAWLQSWINELTCPGQQDGIASPMLTHTKRTFQPSTIKRKRRHGFLARKSTVGGRRVLLRRLLKGRRKLSA